MGTTSEPEPSYPPLSDAIFSMLQGGFRILGGMVQMASGITKLVAVTAIKAASAVEGAVAATDSEPDEADPEPSKVAGSREARGSRRVKATDRRR